MRALGVRMKLNPLRENIAGKRLVVVDDSIVRGTTQRAARARCCARPARPRCTCASRRRPIKWPCFYGMDTGDRGELLAANLTVDEIRDYLDVDTLAYLDARPARSTPPARSAPASATPASPATTRSTVPVDLRKGVLEVEPSDPPPSAADRPRPRRGRRRALPADGREA